jgi:hypothetical protein
VHREQMINVNPSTGGSYVAEKWIVPYREQAG